MHGHGHGWPSDATRMNDIVNKPCNVHHWRVPCVGDQAVSCSDCPATVCFYLKLDVDRRASLLDTIERQTSPNFARLFARRLDEAVTAYKRGLMTKYPVENDETRWASIQSNAPDPGLLEDLSDLASVSIRAQRRRLAVNDKPHGGVRGSSQTQRGHR